MKGFEKNYVSVQSSVKSSEDREILDKSETKILKSRGTRIVPRNTPEEINIRRGETRKRITYENLLCTICKERAD